MILRTTITLISMGTAAVGCASHGADEGGFSEATSASTSQALLGVDTYLYLLCNATSWNPSDETRLVEGPNAGVFQLYFDVAQPWMLNAGDYCQLVETNQLNGWGTQQTSYDTDGVVLSAPTTAPAGPGYQGVPLSYSQLGTHTVSYDSSQMTLSFAEGGSPPVGDLALSGTSELTALTETHAQLFDGNFTLSNQTGSAIAVDEQLFFFAAPGGYAYREPSTDIWWGPNVAAGATLTAGPFGWGWSAPVSHLVVRVDATTSGGAAVSDTTAVPILAPGYQAPEPSPYGGDVTIGVLGPLEVLELADGRRWLGATTSVVDMTNTAGQAPSLGATLLDSNGNAIMPFGITVGHYTDPIRAFLAYGDIPQGADAAQLSITASYPAGTGLPSETRVIPVRTADGVTVESPVSGTWFWANGPGQSDWHVHTEAGGGRYAYDLGIRGQYGQTYSGDPAINESYYAWGEPMYAVMDGTVVYVKDDTPDNNGNLQDNVDLPNNEITIDHGSGLFSRYAHGIQGSAQVSVGQYVTAGAQLARVGNAGGSSEPHLHFHMYRIDATGRVEAVATAINGLTTPSGTPVSGIPAGATEYITP